jgi:hypothetical protein
MNEEINKENIRKEEIKIGIKNALDRQETVEKAKQSMINAGYNSKMVEEAALEMNKSVTPNLQEIGKKGVKKIKRIKQKKGKKKEKVKPVKKAEIKKEETRKLPKTTEAKPKKKKKLAIYIVISIIILVLAALLGLYWDNIVRMF